MCALIQIAPWIRWRNLVRILRYIARNNGIHHWFPKAKLPSKMDWTLWFWIPFSEVKYKWNLWSLCELNSQQSDPFSSPDFRHSIEGNLRALTPMQRADVLRLISGYPHCYSLNRSVKMQPEWTLKMSPSLHWLCLIIREIQDLTHKILYTKSDY